MLSEMLIHTQRSMIRNVIVVIAAAFAVLCKLKFHLECRCVQSRWMLLKTVNRLFQPDDPIRSVDGAPSTRLRAFKEIFSSSFLNQRPSFCNGETPKSRSVLAEFTDCYGSWSGLGKIELFFAWFFVLCPWYVWLNTVMFDYKPYHCGAVRWDIH